MLTPADKYRLWSWFDRLGAYAEPEDWELAGRLGLIDPSIAGLLSSALKSQQQGENDGMVETES